MIHDDSPVKDDDFRYVQFPNGTFSLEVHLRLGSIQHPCKLGRSKTKHAVFVRIWKKHIPICDKCAENDVMIWYVYAIIPVVPHKAVAEVSKIGNL